MSERDKTPAEILREKFRAELKKPISERYFTEEDLINVFDTSGDVFDDYLRTEALILGARLYPESVAMLERRAIHYLDTDKEQFVKFMDDYSDVSSVILNILRLNLLEGAPYEVVVGQIESFLKDFRFTEDEEVIQFVQTVHDLACDRWLVENVERIKKLVPYLPSLLYEYAVLAEESEVLSELAVTVLEELTEIDPYVSDYWTMLAFAYLRFDRTDDALNAIDYALAIDPEHVAALKAKAHIANIANDSETFNETVGRLFEITPDDAEIAALAALRIVNQDKNTFFRFLDSLTPTARSSRTLVLRAIRDEYPKLELMLSELFDNGVREDEDWIGIADFAYECGNFDAVNSILRIYEEKKGSSLNHDFLIFKILFDLGKYDLAAKIFTDAEQGGTLRRAENLYTGYSMFLIALLRMGDFVSARNAAQSLLTMLSEEPDMVGTHLEQRAMCFYLEDILHRLSLKRKTDWNSFEPLS